jgi:hypothetical protein
MAGRSGDEVRERLESSRRWSRRKSAPNSAGVAVPAGILGHRQNETDVVALPFELLELVEEGRGLAVAVRVDERHAVGQILLGDLAEHAADYGDADAVGDEDVLLGSVLGQEEAALGSSTTTSVPTGNSMSERLKAMSRILKAMSRIRVQRPSTLIG